MAKSERASNTPSPYVFLKEEKREFHYLRQPHGYIEGMAFGNLGYQMRFSVCELEKRLLEEGNPHILQLKLYGGGDRMRNPVSWDLFVDGDRIVGGTGEYARQQFEKSSEGFLLECQRYVESADLPALAEHDYHLLKRAREIACIERFGIGGRLL